MKTNRGRAITLGSLSGFVIIGGIIYAVLVAVVTQKASGKVEGSTVLDFIPFWTFGFLYIIPGILGVVAAFVQKKCLYVFVLVVSIIFLVAMVGVINTFAFGFYVGMMYYGDFTYCSTINDQCYCRHTDYTDYTDHYDAPCENFKEINDICIAIFVIVCLTWVVLFVKFIFCCYYTCCARTTSFAGIVLQLAEQTTQEPTCPYPGPPHGTTSLPYTPPHGTTVTAPPYTALPPNGTTVPPYTAPPHGTTVTLTTPPEKNV